jgi:hypothetical protein
VRRLLPILPVLLVFAVPAPLPAQDAGRLQTVREEVRGDNNPAKPAAGSGKDKSKDRSGGQDDAEDDDDGNFGELFWAAAVAPWAAPHILLRDSFDNDSFFRPYPYQGDHRGNMWIDRPDREQPSGLTRPEASTLKAWMGRVTIDESNDFDGLNRVHGQLLLDTNLRLGLQSDWFFLAERRPCGCYDTMTVGDVNLVFRFAECPWLQMRSGLGLRMLFDGGDSRFGFNFTYSADVFPADPWVFSLQFDAGTIGDAALLHGRATVGAIWSRWELFAGYDWLRIGSVDLSGPVVGLRLWF